MEYISKEMLCFTKSQVENLRRKGLSYRAISIKLCGDTTHAVSFWRFLNSDRSKMVLHEKTKKLPTLNHNATLISPITINWDQIHSLRNNGLSWRQISVKLTGFADFGSQLCKAYKDHRPTTTVGKYNVGQKNFYPVWKISEMTNLYLEVPNILINYNLNPSSRRFQDILDEAITYLFTTKLLTTSNNPKAVFLSWLRKRLNGLWNNNKRKEVLIGDLITRESSSFWSYLM